MPCIDYAEDYSLTIRSELKARYEKTLSCIQEMSGMFPNNIPRSANKVLNHNMSSNDKYEKLSNDATSALCDWVHSIGIESVQERASDNLLLWIRDHKLEDQARENKAITELRKLAKKFGYDIKTIKLV